MYEECIATGKAVAPKGNNESQREESECEEGPNCVLVAQRQQSANGSIIFNSFSQGKKDKRHCCSFPSGRIHDNRVEKPGKKRKKMYFNNTQRICVCVC